MKVYSEEYVFTELNPRARIHSLWDLAILETETLHRKLNMHEKSKWILDLAHNGYHQVYSTVLGNKAQVEVWGRVWDVEPEDMSAHTQVIEPPNDK